MNGYDALAQGAIVMMIVFIGCFLAFGAFVAVGGLKIHIACDDCRDRKLREREEQRA